MKNILLAAVLLSSIFLPVSATAATGDYLYNFNSAGVLREAGSSLESTSPYWWLNSGAYLVIQDGVGKTVQGKLASADPFRVLYNRTNPLDTENGYYPQNLFRLVSKRTWSNAETSVTFKVNRHTMTDTPNRDGYSGVLLFARYKDGNNLYYAGIRDDGLAVIKKKVGGTYTTLAGGQVFSGTYNRNTDSSLIPSNQWMRLALETVDQADGSVKIVLKLDKENDGTYQTVATATDKSNPVKGVGSSGIRTDYLDAEFDNFRVSLR
ncbi:MAG: hypothetical protein AAB955_04120 [Patescibacteria group bacterium]